MKNRIRTATFIADEWRFSVWQCFRAKGRSPYSFFFTAAHLPQFELVDYQSDRARVTEVKADTSPRQLCLPFTEWALYQGTEVITRWSYPDAHAGGDPGRTHGVMALSPLIHLETSAFGL